MRSMRFTLLSIALFFASSFSVHAQIPTSGLVAYYPFNGDADDESGTGNDGTVYGATLTSDRFGNSNSAYSFDGSDDYILVPDASSLKPSSAVTLSAWVYIEDNTTRHTVLCKRYATSTSPYNSYVLCASPISSTQYWQASTSHFSVAQSSNTIEKSKWLHLVNVYDGSKVYLYVNGVLEGTASASGSITYTSMGLYIGSAALLSYQYLKGKIDDIRIYSKAVSSTDVKALFLEGMEVKITKEPVSRKVPPGDTASFSVVASGPSLTYQWQVEKNGTFQNLTVACPYSNSMPNILKISPVGKSLYGEYRVIVSNAASADTSITVKLELQGDTSHVVIYDTVEVYDTIAVYDTTHVTVYDTTHVTVYDTTQVIVYDTTTVTVYDTVHVYDTVFVSVMDTLVIDAVLSAGPPAQRNTLKIYPNPAKDRLFIDNGNYQSMDYYSIEIRNALGQKVFHEFIDRQLFTIDLNEWTGKGMYILRLNDKSNKTIEVRKIVLQ